MGHVEYSLWNSEANNNTLTLTSASVLGQVKDTEIYTSLTHTNEQSLTKIPGVEIFQFHAPLLYINVDHFQEALFKATVTPSTSITGMGTSTN